MKQGLNPYPVKPYNAPSKSSYPSEYDTRLLLKSKPNKLKEMLIRSPEDKLSKAQKEYRSNLTKKMDHLDRKVLIVENKTLEDQLHQQRSLNRKSMNLITELLDQKRQNGKITTKKGYSPLVDVPSYRRDYQSHDLHRLDHLYLYGEKYPTIEQEQTKKREVDQILNQYRKGRKNDRTQTMNHRTLPAQYHGHQTEDTQKPAIRMITSMKHLKRAEEEEDNLEESDYNIKDQKVYKMLYEQRQKHSYEIKKHQKGPHTCTGSETIKDVIKNKIMNNNIEIMEKYERDPSSDASITHTPNKKCYTQESMTEEKPKVDRLKEEVLVLKQILNEKNQKIIELECQLMTHNNTSKLHKVSEESQSLKLKHSRGRKIQISHQIVNIKLKSGIQSASFEVQTKSPQSMVNQETSTVWNNVNIGTQIQEVEKEMSIKIQGNEQKEEELENENLLGLESKIKQEEEEEKKLNYYSVLSLDIKPQHNEPIEVAAQTGDDNFEEYIQHNYIEWYFDREYQRSQQRKEN